MTHSILSTKQVELIDELLLENTPEELKWKVELANAILEEADNQIEVGTEIEHQLGTVWVGDIAIVSSTKEVEEEEENSIEEDKIQEIVEDDLDQKEFEDRREGDTC